ncbi:unnamed protein product [Prorocentrum cordatum]|uniref:Uncharacterized protein n=1 Tax=Prorocentrum cordatum TaxID=2364126 RepID=A0ABN9XKZ5_9DINO|nr:unnamed protein product [Polarella glacialis]
MTGVVSDVDAHPAAWGALAGAVELAARGAAAGAAGSTRHVAAAAVAAAVRTAVESLAPLVMAVEAPSANIEELALRLAAVAPALLQAIRGQQAGGAVRAARNLGAHALLGDGAAAPASALGRPTCAQRGGRAARARRAAAAGPWQPSLRRCAAGPSSAATVLEEVDSEMDKSGGGSSGGSGAGPGPWAPSPWCCRDSGEERAAPVAGGGDAAADAPGAASPMVRRGARRRRRRPKSLDVVKTVRFFQKHVSDSDDDGAPGPGKLEGSVGVGPAAPGPPPPLEAADAPARGLGGGEVPGERADRSASDAPASVGSLRSPLGGAQQVDASSGSARSAICSDSARLDAQVVQCLARNDAALVSGGTQAPPACTASEGDGLSSSEGVFVLFLDGFSAAAVARAAKGPKSGVESLLDLAEARVLGVRLGGAGTGGPIRGPAVRRGARGRAPGGRGVRGGRPGGARREGLAGSGGVDRGRSAGPGGGRGVRRRHAGERCPPARRHRRGPSAAAGGTGEAPGERALAPWRVLGVIFLLPLIMFRLCSFAQCLYESGVAGRMGYCVVSVLFSAALDAILCSICSCQCCCT